MGKKKQARVRTETWVRYTETHRQFSGYLDALEDEVPMLDRILKRTSSYDELKKELTDYMKERKELYNFGMNNCP